MSPLGVFEILTQAGFVANNIWPGSGYSGYRAIFAMGNKITIPLTFVGDAVFFAYRMGNKLKHLVARSPNWPIDRIDEIARVAGATDWIATKPE